MKKAALAAALMTTALLAGCGGGADEEPAASGAGAISAPADDNGGDREKSLKRAIEGYANAQLAGDITGVMGYLNPDKCSDDDKGSLAIAVGLMKETAKGATIKIKAVKIEGNRGTYTEYELSGNAPDALRRLFKTQERESGGKMGWEYIDGEWYRDGGCEGDPSASPSPTA